MYERKWHAAGADRRRASLLPGNRRRVGVARVLARRTTRSEDGAMRGETSPPPVAPRRVPPDEEDKGATVRRRLRRGGDAAAPGAAHCEPPLRSRGVWALLGRRSSSRDAMVKLAATTRCAKRCERASRVFLPARGALRSRDASATLAPDARSREADSAWPLSAARMCAARADPPPADGAATEAWIGVGRDTGREKQGRDARPARHRR